MTLSKHIIPPIIFKLANAAISVLNDAVEDPLDEIRGHLTAHILREWINKNRTVSTQSRGCAVHYDSASQKVAAFIVDDESNNVFNNKGFRVAAVFKAKSIDKELRQLFAKDTTILIPFGAEE